MERRINVGLYSRADGDWRGDRRFISLSGRGSRRTRGRPSQFNGRDHYLDEASGISTRVFTERRRYTMQDAREVPPESTLDLHDFSETQTSIPARPTTDPRMVRPANDPSFSPIVEGSQPATEENRATPRAKSKGKLS